jgi:hypothetical protein
VPAAARRVLAGLTHLHTLAMALPGDEAAGGPALMQLSALSGLEELSVKVRAAVHALAASCGVLGGQMHQKLLCLLRLIVPVCAHGVRRSVSKPAPGRQLALRLLQVLAWRRERRLGPR